MARRASSCIRLARLPQRTTAEPETTSGTVGHPVLRPTEPPGSPRPRPYQNTRSRKIVHPERGTTRSTASRAPQSGPERPVELRLTGGRDHSGLTATRYSTTWAVELRGDENAARGQPACNLPSHDLPRISRQCPCRRLSWAGPGQLRTADGGAGSPWLDLAHDDGA